MKRMFLVWILVFLGSSTSLLFAQNSLPAKEGKSAALKSGYVDNARCVRCHSDAAKSYLKGGHALTKNPKSPGSNMKCQSCHGPGEKHARSRGDYPMLKLGPNSKLSASEKNKACLSCHQTDSTKHWKGSVHQRAGISCVDCHNPHGGNHKELRFKKQTKTCVQCHKGVRSELGKRSHHPLREDKMKCTDCHNPHGTLGDVLVNALSVNKKCYECHAEHRGPHLWEHAPVTENCTTCHKSHGSSHEKLLKARAPMLCQRCHSNSRHPGTLYSQNTGNANQTVYQSRNNRLFYKGCMNCHTNVHGSNHPSGKSLLR